MKKIKNITLISIYFLSTAVFLAVDFTMSESLTVFVNVTLLMLIASLFLVGIRVLFEILLLRLGYHFSHQVFLWKDIFQVVINSLVAPIVVLCLGIVFQLVVLKKEAPQFQIVIFSFSELAYIALLLYQLNKEKFLKAVNLLMGSYLLLYLIYQGISIFGGLK